MGMKGGVDPFNGKSSKRKRCPLGSLLLKAGASLAERVESKGGRILCYGESRRVGAQNWTIWGKGGRLKDCEERKRETTNGKQKGTEEPRQSRKEGARGDLIKGKGMGRGGDCRRGVEGNLPHLYGTQEESVLTYK